MDISAQPRNDVREPHRFAVRSLENVFASMSHSTRQVLAAFSDENIAPKPEKLRRAYTKVRGQTQTRAVVLRLRPCPQSPSQSPSPWLRFTKLLPLQSNSGVKMSTVRLPILLAETTTVMRTAVSGRLRGIQLSSPQRVASSGFRHFFNTGSS